MQLQVTGGKIFGGRKHQTDGEHLKKKSFQTSSCVCRTATEKEVGMVGDGLVLLLGRKKLVQLFMDFHPSLFYGSVQLQVWLVQP